MKTLSLWLILAGVFVSSVNAEARYFRFWRGNIKQGMAYSQFTQGLNEIFVPATGQLMQSEAKLQSYQPVLFSPQQIEENKLPAEIALVEYESEQTYLNYRSTPQGKAYGDLHWDYFQRENSRSLVVEKYNDQIEKEKAYLIENQTDFSFYRGNSFFKIYKKQTAGDWLQAVKDHIDRINKTDALAVIFLVSEDYVMEYSLRAVVKDSFDPQFEKDSDLVFNSVLSEGRVLNPGAGLKFK